MQAKLLRVLQDGRFQRLGSTRDIQVDVRVISATHVDIQKAIAENRFREDLYYRLNVVHLTLPPLRGHPEDIALLADHFLKKYLVKMQKNVRAIAPQALDQLLAHQWPGNVRELENTIQRALAVATDDIIQSFHLTPPPRSGGPSASYGPAVTIPVGTTLEEADNLLISETLNQCGGDKEKAAKMLGVSSRTLYRHFSKDER